MDCRCAAFPRKRHCLHHSEEGSTQPQICANQDFPVQADEVYQLRSAVKGASRQMPHAGKITSLSNHSYFARYSISNPYSLIVWTALDPIPLTPPPRRTLDRSGTMYLEMLGRRDTWTLLSFVALGAV
jgi:hypothetical protein